MVKSRQKPIDDPLIQDLAGIGVATLGILLLIGLFWPESGFIVKGLGIGLKTITGLGSFIVPFVLILSGYYLITGTEIPTTKRKMVGFILLFAVLISWAQLYKTPDILSIYNDRANNPIYLSNLTNGGGYLGFGLALVLTKVFGNIGNHIVLAVSLIVSLILITGKNITSMVSSVKNINNSASKRNRYNSEDETQYNPRKTAKTIENAENLKKKSKPSLLSVFKKNDSKSDLTTEKEEPKQQIKINEYNNGEVDNKKKTNNAKIQQVEADYKFPPITILKEPQPQPKRAQAELNYKIDRIEQTLDEFNIDADVVEVSNGPTVTRYEIQLAPGIKVSKIVSLADNLAMSLAAIDVRVEAPIPGKSAIGVEVPNDNPATVTLREVIDNEQFWNAPTKLTFPLGKDVAGVPRYADLTKMPHMLIAGATNSGKSVCINALIAGILFRATPREVKFILIDPKRVELSMYDGIPHLITPVVRDVKQAAGILRSAMKEMEHRYDMFVAAGTKDFTGYNKKAKPEERLPYIVIVVDELADLMMQAGPDIEFAIFRIAQLARAAGIHLVIATQRPSVDVVTGTIKANISSRISFAVNSQTDSRTILDQGGAERLIGRGDMLFKPIDSNKPTRIQGCLVTDTEIENLVKHLKEQELPDYTMVPIQIGEAGSGGGGIDDASTDELYESAVRLIVTSGSASTSMLQRRFKIGYTRAARIVDTMEEQGIVGPLDGAKPREVLIGKDDVDRIFGGSNRINENEPLTIDEDFQ